MHRTLNDIFKEAGESSAFIAESNPQHTITLALPSIASSVGTLAAEAEYICAQFKIVDAAPRHDSLLNAPEALVPYGRYSQRTDGLNEASHQLLGMMVKLRMAILPLQDVLRGEEKIRLYERMKRDLARYEELHTEVEKLARMPETNLHPHQVRQNRLTDFLVSLTRTIEALKPVREQLKREGLDGECMAQVMAYETTLYKIRSRVRKWRDNPSQRMSRQMGTLGLELKAMAASMQDMRKAARKTCRDQGMRVFNRTGEVFD